MYVPISTDQVKQFTDMLREFVKTENTKPETERIGLTPVTAGFAAATIAGGAMLVDESDRQRWIAEVIALVIGVIPGTIRSSENT